MLGAPDARGALAPFASKRRHPGGNGREDGRADDDHEDVRRAGTGGLGFVAVLVFLAAAAGARLVASRLGHLSRVTLPQCADAGKMPARQLSSDTAKT